MRPFSMRPFLVQRLVVLLGVAVTGVAAAPRDAAQIDTLLNALRGAPDEQTAAALELRLRLAWRHAGSPASALLVDRAARELAAGSPEAAIEDTDAALVLEPDYAEAFVARGAARLNGGDAAGAVRDAAEALRREPRDLDALMLLSRAAEQHGDAAAAYAAWQKVMDLDPKTANGATRLRDLRQRAVGEDI
jgi:cytochrome c-type biogenesis protein CcmH/NrfG